MEERTLEAFLNHFCNDKRAARKCCFILGAGASKTSGIPTGAELVKQWIAELNHIHGEDNIGEWLDKNGISRDDLAAAYSEIYDKRFEMDEKEGYAFLETLMEGVDPSCGYSILAQILTQKQHNIVITTNFDSLTEDALFIYTKKKPLVIGHEALAGYIKTYVRRPIIVKIHRDLLLSPENTKEGTKEIKANFKKNLESVFEQYTPLVIGYGGNDGSLMGYLESLDKMDGKIFWFYRKADGDLGPRIQSVIEKFRGFAIQIPGFDELMVQLGNKLGLERLNDKVVTIAKQRATKYREQFEKIMKEAGDAETKKAFTGIVARGNKDWWYYELKANKEKDIDKRDKIYQAGIKKFPKNPDLLGSYAKFLCDNKREYDRAVEYYKRAIESDQVNEIILSDFAILLARTRKDYDKAEELLKKSIQLDPLNIITLCNYANFLLSIRNDFDESKKLFIKVFELNPFYATCHAGYAKYLILQGNMVESRQHIQSAFELKHPDDKRLELILWFYCYSVFFDEYKNARNKIEELLSQGINLPGGLLEGVLKVAKEMNHPDYDKLCEYAERISAVDFIKGGAD